jgi:mRNA interferase HicA
MGQGADIDLSQHNGFWNGRRYSILENRTKVFENWEVKGREFLRKVKSIAKRNKLAYRWNPERGAGSHGTVYLGARFTVVKDLKKELGPGLLADMCKQLGIRKEDL